MLTLSRNLANANHIIFVSPLLVESKHKYDLAMTQAIGRSRYGQEMKVHICHFAALRTIDVYIFEHRYERTNGITAAKSTVRMPSESLTTPEKIKLVKKKQGSTALVPVSWLAEEKTWERLSVEEEPRLSRPSSTFPRHPRTAKSRRDVIYENLHSEESCLYEAIFWYSERGELHPSSSSLFRTVLVY